MAPGLLKVVVEDSSIVPSLRALCAGFEDGRWRSAELVTAMFDWLPDFALTYSERETFDSRTGVQQLRKAAQTVYSTDKYRRRGEFGELLLHMVLREIFGTEPAVSKIYYKDGANETVKGFDAVHAVIAPDGELEIWLGEVKFYNDLGSAIRDIAAELLVHFQANYLRSEFGAVVNKVDAKWPHSGALKQLLHPNTSLDAVRPRIRVPALVTYDSVALRSNTRHCDDYVSQLAEEALGAQSAFAGRGAPNDVTIHLLLVPLLEKAEFVKELHDRLQVWKAI